MLDAAWEATYNGQRLGEAILKYKNWQEFCLRLANIKSETQFAYIVNIRTETDKKKISEFNERERKIYYDWRRKTMTKEEIRQEEINNANAIIAALGGIKRG